MSYKTHVTDGAVPNEGLQGSHLWPRDGGHFWGPWMPNTPRDGTKKATQYRTCLHPHCQGVEVREVV